MNALAKQVVFVGDRGMITSARIREDMAEDKGLIGLPRYAPPPFRNWQWMELYSRRCLMPPTGRQIQPS